MKFIKSYQIFESKDKLLEYILKKFNIFYYTINEDGSMNCEQDIDLSYKYLTKIPIKFNRINGYFNIINNNLISLSNCPTYIEGVFECSFNLLTSLEFSPEYVGGNYYCNNNQLITLKGCVEEVYGSFNCKNNKLTSLEFCPMQVEGYFDCSYNKLTELDRSPFVRKEFYCGGMFKTEPIFNGFCEKLVWK